MAIYVGDVPNKIGRMRCVYIVYDVRSSYQLDTKTGCSNGYFLLKYRSQLILLYFKLRGKVTLKSSVLLLVKDVCTSLHCSQCCDSVVTLRLHCYCTVVRMLLHCYYVVVTSVTLKQVVVMATFYQYVSEPILLYLN